MELRLVDPKTLRLNPNNPRRVKAASELDAQLTANIKAIGVIQPPLVRADGDALEIIAGERRVRCAIAAGVTELHVLVSGTEDGNDPLRALAENTQRQQMNPVDQWRAIEALCGGGWNEEAIATAFSMTVRTIRKLRLLAKIHPKMLDRMAYEMPREEELRKIASAPLEEQAATWKRLKPKKGDEVCWWDIVRALDIRRLPAKTASFGQEDAVAFGVTWQEDLFGPADEDNRYTTDIESFFLAQRHWVETNMPENGIFLDADRFGNPQLPPKSERIWGNPRTSDMVGFFINERTGAVEQMGFRMKEAAVPQGKGGAVVQAGDGTAPPAARPDITKKGLEQIGDYRTEALHRGFQEAEMDDLTLVGLLVLAFAAENVDVRGDQRQRGREEIVRSITDGGVLTSDAALLRQAGRNMLGAVLNCSLRYHGSGRLARIAEAEIDADRYLPTMATEDFLKLLSKSGIERAARDAEVPVLPQTGKEIRAALLRHIGQDHYVLPAARFAFSTAELEAERLGEEKRASLWAEDDGDDDLADDEESSFSDEDYIGEDDEAMQDAA